jgi:hypothetical protein
MTGATGGEQVFESLVHLYSAEPLENEIGWDDMKQGHEEQGCIRGKKAMRHTCNIYIYITYELDVSVFLNFRPYAFVSECQEPPVGSVRKSAPMFARTSTSLRHRIRAPVRHQQAIQKLDQSNDFLRFSWKHTGTGWVIQWQHWQCKLLLHLWHFIEAGWQAVPRSGGGHCSKSHKRIWQGL